MPVTSPSQNQTLKSALEKGIKVYIKCTDIEDRLRIDRLIKNVIPDSQRDLVNFGLRDPGMEDNLIILQSTDVA